MIIRMVVSLLGFDHGFENPEVGQRAVEVVSVGYLDVVYNVQPLDHLTKDGIFAI